MKELSDSVNANQWTKLRPFKSGFDVVLPGYGRVDAMASYVFGPTHREEKRYKITVNIQNLANRRYFETGNTPTVIFPGSPINVQTQFQVRF